MNLTQFNKVMLHDLENNMPTAKILRSLMTHYSTLYVFNCQGGFNYALEDLTELASWLTSGQVVILETPQVKEKEFEYAVIVGQLMALLEPEVHIDVMSAMPSSTMLIEMMSASGLKCRLMQVETTQKKRGASSKMPTIKTIQAQPYLQLVKRYCDALDKMTGQPNTIEKLRHSIGNILQLVPEKAQKLVATLINLKIIKHQQQQVTVRKKILKQWAQLDLNEAEQIAKVESVDAILAQLHTQLEADEKHVATPDTLQHVQQGLFKNFSKLDPMQLEVIHKLHALKSKKPKDIYELRDLLEHMFPQADVRLLLKELIEKGYIYWNGLAVVYSHEMFLN